MKVTLDLTTNVKHAIGLDEAEKCSQAWFEGAFEGNCPNVDKLTLNTLYHFAFVDGMDYIIDLITKKQNECRGKENNSLEPGT